MRYFMPALLLFSACNAPTQTTTLISTPQVIPTQPPSAYPAQPTLSEPLAPTPAPSPSPTPTCVTLPEGALFTATLFSEPDTQNLRDTDYAVASLDLAWVDGSFTYTTLTVVTVTPSATSTVTCSYANGAPLNDACPTLTLAQPQCAKDNLTVTGAFSLTTTCAECAIAGAYVFTYDATVLP